jgi:prepilin-type processing-associated H-X9-DG protein
MYQSEYSGYFPSAGNSMQLPQDWIHWQTTRMLSNSAVVPYMGGNFKPKVFTCPSDPNGRAATKYQYSYTANVNIFVVVGATNPAIPSVPVRFSAIRSPATKITLVEEDGQTIDDSAWAPQNYVANTDNVLGVRHDKLGDNKMLATWGKGPAAFADGHAETIARSDAMKPAAYDPKLP